MFLLLINYIHFLFTHNRYLNALNILSLIYKFAYVF